MDHKLILLIVGLVISFATAVIVLPEEHVETVIKVVDGDTIYTENYKIRLSLTNTPERGEVGWKKATEFTENMCPVGSPVIIIIDKGQPTDRYGRTVAEVFCNDRLLNSELLYNNLAVISTDYCDVSAFSHEKWAKDYGC